MLFFHVFLLPHIPTRMTPNYHLWQLYRKQGDDNQARAMAQKIISQPLKVETTFTLRIKGQVRQYLMLGDP